MRSIALLILVIFALPLSAQKLKYRIEHIGAEQGLSQGSVYSMYKDPNGHMWFGTLDGLNFWNGKTMKVYRPSLKDKYSIEGIDIKQIIGFGVSDLLIGTENCLNIYESEKSRFKKVYFRNSKGQVVKSEVFPIGVAGNELKLWLSGVGLINYNFLTKKQTILVSENRFRTDYFSNINTTQSDLGDNVWLHTEDGLLKYNTKSKKLSYYFSNNAKNIVGKKEEIVKILVDLENVWLGTFDGFVKFNSRTLEIKKWTDFGKNRPIGHVFDVVSDKNGKLWIGTERNGLLCFDTQSETFEQISNKGSFSNFKLHNNEISHVYIDPDGIIWANTDPYGVDKIQILPGNLGSFKLNLNERLPEVMQNFSIRTILKDNDVLWLGTQQAGIWKVNADDFDIIEGFHSLNTKSFRSNTVRFTHKDSQGAIWIGTSEGLLYCQNGKFSEVVFHKNKMSSNFIRVIEEYKNKLWIGTESGVLKVNIKTKTEELSPLFKDKRISMIRFLSDTRLLIGVYNEGLYELNSSDGFKTCKTTQVFKDCIPISLKILGQFAWIATSKGLVRLNLKDGKLKWYSVEDGLPNEFVNAIEIDESHNLWLSTNKGIVKFVPQTAEISILNLNDGIQGFEFNGYSSFRDSGSGTIYFGGINGLNHFNPLNLIIPKKINENILRNDIKSIEPQNYQTFLDEKSLFKEPLIFDTTFSTSFKKLKGPLPNFLYTDGTAWVKFNLRNESSQKWYLEVENTRISELEVWVFEKNRKINYAKTGDKYGFAKYLTKDPNPTVELDLIENQQYEVYVKARTTRDLKIPIKIWNASALSEHQSNRKFVWGIFIGFIILISFYNLFLWITIKDSIYIYYMTYILSFGLFQFSIYGFAFQYFWSNHPFNEYAFLMFLYVSYIFITLFTEKFLELGKTVKNWRYIRTFIFICSVGLLLITPFWHPNQINYFAIALSLLFSVLYYLLCFIYIKAKNPLILYYALAIFFLTTASTILAFQNLGIISSINQEYVLMTGSMFEIVLFSVALGYKFRQNQLEKERQQLLRNQISGNLHDDLAASLSSLTMYTELSKRKLDLPQNELLERFERISFKSREILAKVREAVYELNPKNDEEEEWLERIVNFGKDIFESKNIEFRALIPEGFDSKSVVSEHRREFFLIFKEAMNNAAKYSEATTVVFEVKKVIGAKEFKLKDDGKGIENDRLNAGNGLSNIKERANKINATLVINTQNGTEVILITK